MSAPFLALDAATAVASVAIGVESRSVTERLVDQGGRQHAAQLLPSVTDLLALAGVRPEALGGVVVGDGPGSFTGVRIVAALAKGLIHGTAVPLFAMPSLLGCAWRAARAAGIEGPVGAVYDALRGDVFVAVYRGTTAIVEPRVISARDLPALSRVLLAAGEGAARYAEAARSWTARTPLGPPAGRSSAAALLEALWTDPERFRVAAPATWEPVYGRPAEAQVRWEALHGRPLPDPSRSGA